MLCGYLCMYFLDEMNKGKSFLEVLKPLLLTDKMYNEEFIINYFS